MAVSPAEAHYLSYKHPLKGSVTQDDVRRGVTATSGSSVGGNVRDNGSRPWCANLVLEKPGQLCLSVSSGAQPIPPLASQDKYSPSAACFWPASAIMQRPGCTSRC